MAVSDPITVWIRQLEQADDSAAQALWDHYCGRLRAMARRKLAADTRRVYDEDDAALSAFHSMCQGAQEGRFPKLGDRKDLWRLLMVITARKVAMRHRHDRREKRDIHRVRGDSVFAESPSGNRAGKQNALVSRDPTPAFAVEVAETCENLYRQLGDDALRCVAAMKLQGFSAPQIARQMECSTRTVERKLERIRRRWERESLV